MGVGFHLREYPFHIPASRLMAKATIGPAVVAHAQLAYRRRGEEREPRRTGLSEWWAGVTDFHQTIQQDREPLASGIDGRRVVEVTQAMVESAWNHRSVRIEPISL